MTMTLVKLSYNSKLVPDPGLVLQTPLCKSYDLLAYMATSGGHFSRPLGMEAFEANQYL